MPDRSPSALPSHQQIRDAVEIYDQIVRGHHDPVGLISEALAAAHRQGVWEATMPARRNPEDDPEDNC